MAGSINKVILVGNVGQDPQVRTMQNGQKVVEDVKGFMTKDYKIKKKLFLLKLVATGEDIIFKEIFREEETKHADTSDEA